MTPTSPQHVLVTGAAGFIGANVCAQLLAQGCTVLGIDNMNDAYDIRLKQWRLAQLNGQERFSFFQADITDRSALNAAVNRVRHLDAIINLAARAGVRQSVANPWIYIDTNVTGTLNLLELCREQGITKFVLASTSSLYGAQTPRPFSEEADTSGPLSPYAASKKAAESFCYTYHYLYQIDISVLRYFTVYGPGGRPDMSMFRFTQWISEGEPVLIYGDGQQERDFTYVDDIARGTIAALKPLGYEVINLGSDTPVVLMDVVQTLEELLHKEAKLDHQPMHLADMRATWANIAKAERLLGWRPQTTFATGASRLVEWYRTHEDWTREIITR